MIGPTATWILAAEMGYTSFPISGVQVEFYVQEAAEDTDRFLVEILYPFTKTLPGSITLDLGTAGDPVAYLFAFDLTQGVGAHSVATAASTGSGLNSLIATTSLKARINYTPGALLTGGFAVRLRSATVKNLGA